VGKRQNRAASSLGGVTGGRWGHPEPLTKSKMGEKKKGNKKTRSIVSHLLQRPDAQPGGGTHGHEGRKLLKKKKPNGRRKTKKEQQQRKLF